VADVVVVNQENTVTGVVVEVDVVTAAEQGPSGAIALGAHEAASDPHPQYLTEAEADAAYAASDHTHAGYEASGTAATLVAAHEAAANPHPAYLTQAEADALYEPAGDYASATHGHAIADTTGLQAALDGKASATHDHDAEYAAIGHDHSGVYQPAGSYAAASHSHATSDVTGLDTALAGKEASGTAASLITAHEAAADPHPTYLTQAEADALYAAAGSGGTGDMVKATYDTDDDGKVNAAETADAAPWAGITGKPTTFPPETHAHDDLYYTEAEVDTALAGKADAAHDHDATYAPLTHSHAIADVTGLQTALDGKQAAGSYAAATHTHDWADVTGEPTTLAGYGITDAASSTHDHDGDYAALAHTHAIADTTGLQAALDGKQAAGSYAAASHTHPSTEVSDFAEAVYDTVAAIITAGTNVTVTPNDTSNTVTIDASGGGSTTLDGLTDVTITSPADGHVLTYDGSGWVNEAPSGGGAGGLGVYGNGADGDLTISSGTTTLAGDAYYNNLTVDAGARLNTANYRVFVRGTLTNNGAVSCNGGDASGQTAGTFTPNTVYGTSPAGGAGGTTGAGTNGGNTSQALGNAGGAGGASDGGVGANAGVVTPPTAAQGGAQLVYALPQAVNPLILGTSPLQLKGGASGGGGRAATAGQDGGGGGGAGGVCMVAAAALAGTGTLEAKGGAGGNAVGGNAGGGGGGGGGCVILVTRSGTSVGSFGTATYSVGGVTVDVSGGSGGSGSGSGSAGSAGSHGRISVLVTG
jgi:hypothetical protein